MFPQSQPKPFDPNQAIGAVGSSIFAGLKGAFNSIGSPQGLPSQGPDLSTPQTSPLSMGTLNLASNTQPIVKGNTQPQQNTPTTSPVNLATPQFNANVKPQTQGFNNAPAGTPISPNQQNTFTTPSGAQVDATTGQLIGGTPQQGQQNTQSTQQQGPIQQALSQFQTPQNQEYIKQQLDVIQRMAALQGQLAQLNVPSPTEISQQNLENQMRLNLANLNPQQFLKDNPSLQKGGITEGQLERQVAQEQMPLEQTLSQAIISKSALANVRSNEAQAVGAQSQGLGALSSAIQQARQLTQFGGLPPEIASAILQKQMFPQQQVTTDAFGQPIGVTFNPTGGIAGTQGIGAQVFGGQGGQGGGALGSLAQQVANGQMSYEQAIGGLSTPGQKLALNQAIQQINPNFSSTFSQANYSATQQALQNAVPLVQAQQTALQHLDALQTALDKVDYGNFPLINGIRNLFSAKGVQNPDIQNVQSEIGIVRGEVAKVLGAGQVTVEGMNEAKEIVPDSISPQNFSNVRSKIQDLMQSKIQQYSNPSNIPQFGGQSQNNQQGAQSYQLPNGTVVHQQADGTYQ